MAATNGFANSSEAIEASHGSQPFLIDSAFFYHLDEVFLSTKTKLPFPKIFWLCLLSTPPTLLQT